jgi:hypothetical protein
MVTLWEWPASVDDAKVRDVLSDGPEGEPLSEEEQPLCRRSANPKDPPARADDLRKSRLFIFLVSLDKRTFSYFKYNQQVSCQVIGLA